MAPSDVDGPAGLRIHQIVFGGLIAGLAGFLVFATLSTTEPFDPTAILEAETVWLTVISIFGLAILATVPGLSEILIRRTAAEFRGREPAPEELLQAYYVFVILRGALVEGLGFFGVVLFFALRVHLGLLVGLAALLILLVMFPTRDRFRNYCDRLSGGPV